MNRVCEWGVGTPKPSSLSSARGSAECLSVDCLSIRLIHFDGCWLSFDWSGFLGGLSCLTAGQYWGKVSDYRTLGVVKW